MKCGIAIYAADLIEALPSHEHSRFALHYGENPCPNADYDCDVNDFRSITAFAERINNSGVEVLCLQHEFGIWGGLNGENLFDFLQTVKLPIVSTLHTTFPRGSRPAVQFLELQALTNASHAVLVLTERSRQTLCSALEISLDRINVVPHGVSETCYAGFPEPLDDEGREHWRFCSLGFFRPDKGLEMILEALATLKDRGLNFSYAIAGEPQPQFQEQRDYYNEIVAYADRLGLADCVRFIPKFLSRDEQVSLIHWAHAGIFAYQEPDHASSGAMPLVLSAGRPTICTPFEFAKAKADEGRGVVIGDGFDATSIGAAIAKLTAMKRDLSDICDDLYKRTRPWTWPAIGLIYEKAFEKGQRGILAPS